MKTIVQTQPIHKTMPTRGVKDATAGRYRFIISTDSVDRSLDKIHQDGWQLDTYRQSPVVLWGHDYSSPPIGKSVEVIVRNGRLEAVLEFVPEGLYELADVVQGLVGSGHLINSSVGFQALEYEYDTKRGGVNFLKQFLLEWSVVSIPANPDARICVNGRCDKSAVWAWAKSAPAPQLLQTDSLFTVDERELAKAAQQVVHEAMAGAIAGGVRQEFNALRGRVD